MAPKKSGNGSGGAKGKSRAPKSQATAPQPEEEQSEDEQPEYEQPEEPEPMESEATKAYRNLRGISREEATRILTNFHDHHFHEVDGLDRRNKCQQYCLRILKALRSKFPNMQKLKTYYFKDVLLHLIRKRKLNWDQENMADRVLDLLEHVKSTLLDRTSTIVEIDIPSKGYLMPHDRKKITENIAQQVHSIRVNKHDTFRKSFAI